MYTDFTHLKALVNDPCILSQFELFTLPSLHKTNISLLNRMIRSALDMYSLFVVNVC